MAGRREAMESATENRLPMADARLCGRKVAKSRSCSEKDVGSGDGETVRASQGARAFARLPGKSLPRTWQHGRHAKPHPEQDQIGGR